MNNVMNDLSLLTRYDLTTGTAYDGPDEIGDSVYMDIHQDGDYVKFADVQAMISKQVQQPTLIDNLKSDYSPRQAPDVAPEPFIVGNQYRTQGGRIVRFIGIANEGTSYETMFDELGHHRYTRRDFGRGTGAPWGDDCVPPLYTAQPLQQDGGEDADTYRHIKSRARCTNSCASARWKPT